MAVKVLILSTLQPHSVSGHSSHQTLLIHSSTFGVAPNNSASPCLSLLPNGKVQKVQKEKKKKVKKKEKREKKKTLILSYFFIIIFMVRSVYGNI